jgi:nicotinamide phosphoribosyltransferase
MQKINIDNILFNTDSYKVSMSEQYPPGTEYIRSYISSRGGVFDEVMFAGLQPFLKNVLSMRITREDVLLADKLWKIHGEPFPLEKWLYIVDKCDGKLPLKISAVKEGTVVPVKNVLLTIINTDPECYWLTTWVETAMLRAVWYMTDVATKSFQIKKVLQTYLEKSGDPNGLMFKLHDFGARGAHSNESASLGAAGHLFNFMGTDTFVGILRLINDYDAAIEEVGFSIPAGEHSTVTSWGKTGEIDAYFNFVKQFSKPGSIYAVVSDSYDIYNACEMWSTGELKEAVIAGGGKLVIRPDSGDPLVVLPKMLHILGDNFGFTVNSKGYKVLNHVAVIWGDGINKQSIEAILRTMVDLHGWSADNFAFGMGGALLGSSQRDDQKWAMKCSQAGIRKNGKLEWFDVFKDPVTDSSKSSLKGDVILVKNHGEIRTIRREEILISDIAMLELKFIDGEIVNSIKFPDIRK